METIVEEEKKTEEKKEITVQEFLVQSFETIFDQNYRLHASLNESLEKRFKELKEELKEDIQKSTQELKDGFLFYTRDIMSGIAEANEDIKAYCSKCDWDAIVRDANTLGQLNVTEE
jgi:hypothetical protein